jgi:acyl-CoA synthetase (NDP forming)
MKTRVKEILAQSRQDGWVIEPRAKELFEEFGLPTTKYYWAKSHEEAVRAAEKIGYPLVVKVVSVEVMHKTEVQGVEVGVKDQDQLKSVYQRMQKLPSFQGVLLDEMVFGVELIIGSKQDVQFGTIVMVGIGGVAVEVYQDVALRMAPLSADHALAAINTLQGKKLLDGFRGQAPINKPALVDLLVSFSKLAYQLKDHIESIDLNPVFANSQTAVIADARLVLRD